MYYQGSDQSTSKGIENVFSKARSYSNTNQINVIFFDEIGMAELNSNNPLKVLHKLLDDPNEKDNETKSSNEIAFISISNWRLDLSKMSRSFYISRPDPQIDDLKETAYHLMTNKKNKSNEDYLNNNEKEIKKQTNYISESYQTLRKNKNMDVIIYIFY